MISSEQTSTVILSLAIYVISRFFNSAVAFYLYDNKHETQLGAKGFFSDGV